MTPTIEPLECRALMSATLPGLVPLYKQESELRGAISALKETSGVDGKVLTQDVKRLNALAADSALLRALVTGTRAADVALHKDVSQAVSLINKQLNHLILDVIRAVKNPANLRLQGAPIADRQKLLADSAAVLQTLVARSDSTAESVNANFAAIGDAHPQDGQTRSDAGKAASHRIANSQTIKSRATAFAATLDDLLSGF